MTTQEWKAEPYRPGDENGINDLFLRVFGIRRSTEEWKWKFRDGPLGDRSIIQLAREGDRIVGQYAIVFSRFLCCGKEVVAIQAVDIMVDKDWRGSLGGSSILPALLRNVKQDPAMATAGIGYGFPNPKHYAIIQKIMENLGYESMGAVDLRHRSLTCARHLRRLPGSGVISRTAGRVHARLLRGWIRLRTPHIPGIKARRIYDFDDRFDRLWDRSCTSFGVLAVRDRRHLEWRFGRKPSGTYTILALEDGEDLVGYAVLAIREGAVRFGRVADILSVPDMGIAERLVQSVLEYFLQAGCDIAECWSVPGGYYHDLLKKYFPRQAAEPVQTVLRIYDKALDTSVLRDLSQWHLTLGDADGI